MRIIKLRRNRLVNLLAGAAVILLILYVLFFSSDDRVTKIMGYWGEGLKGVKKVRV